MPIVLLHVFEPFEVQRQNDGQLLDAHALLCLLVARTVVTFELVIRAERFSVTEALQTMGDACVLVYIHLQVEEVFVLAAYLKSQQTCDCKMTQGRFY